MPETWAQRQADQNEKIAQRLYDDELQAVETFGPQPLDPETGEPQERIPESEQAEMHEVLRDSDIGMLTVLMEEAEKLGLSEGLLPRKMIEGMLVAERRHLRQPVEPELSEVEGGE